MPFAECDKRDRVARAMVDSLDEMAFAWTVSDLCSVPIEGSIDFLKLAQVAIEALAAMEPPP